MKKIINWTFGSVFRTFGRIIAYLSIGLLISLIVAKNDIKITDLLGFTKVYASEVVSTDLNKFYVRTCDFSGSNCEWSTSSDMGTSISTGSVVMDGFRGRFGSSSKFLKGVKYRVKFNVAMTNAISTSDCDLWYYKVKNVICSGSLSSSWESNQDLIESCQFISRSCYTAGDQVRAHYYYDIVTNTDVYGIQINSYFKNQYFFNVGGINLMTSSNVSYDRDTTDAINNSTTSIINNNTENTQEIINNNNENTQTIINNQNENTQEQIESQKVCNKIDKNNVKEIHKYLYAQGQVYSASGNFGITDYINIKNAEINVLQVINYNPAIHLCYYTFNKSIISCENEYNLTELTIPTNAYYIRFSIQYEQDIPNYEICQNGNQALLEQQQQNTENIINNQNTNTQQQIESQSVCYSLDKSYISENGKRLNSSGVVSNASNKGITKMIDTKGTSFHYSTNQAIIGNYYCTYDEGGSLVSCYNISSSIQIGDEIIFNSDERYVRFTLTNNTNYKFIKVCLHGNQANYEMNHSVYEGIHDLDNTINNSDTSESSNSFMDFLDNFTETDFGLASIITMPLTFITTITSNTCQEVVLPIPYLDNNNLTLPCMRDIYDTYFGGFMTIYDIITFGIISYKILLDIFRMLHNFRNPENNEIEVLDL